MAKKPAAKKTRAKSLTKGKPGRPTLYTKEIADEILTWLSDGKSLRSYCQQEGKPDKATVIRWLAVHEEFATNYARARDLLADAIVDDVLDIADDGSNDTYITDSGARRIDTEVVARSKLRVEARLKLAALLAPKKYGDKLDLTVDDKRPSTPEERRARIEQLLAMGVAGATKPAGGV